ncbi:uncharacterized protein LOC119076722 [Bradysia coprophila]|uniref:uncharacterized protein LOC119076722 n=1 Tax=Bradysia coprophila TaxID=38358 RepID=UPI00187DADEB|nr:uncharacterized protein LOC119076722 [Bradysia coprophila]
MQLSNFAKIGIGWTLAVGVGLYGFIASKSSIDKRRYQDMKIRERMRQSNVGDYERSERRF